MKNKHESNSPLATERELRVLKEENGRLRDSLILQNSALEREKREKQDYITKYHRLQQEKAEAIRRYQDLLMVLIKNNINFDDNPFARIIDSEPSNPVVASRESGTAIQARKTSQQRGPDLPDPVTHPTLLNKILNKNTQTVKGTLPGLTEELQAKLQAGQLMTLKQVNGGTSEYAPSIQRLNKDSQGQASRRKMSYLQKVKSGLT